MKIPQDEQEIVATILTTDKDWQVNVSEPRLLKRLLDRYQPTRVHKDDVDGIYAAEFMLPRKAIRFVLAKGPEKPKKPSDPVVVARMAEMRAKRTRKTASSE